MQNKFSENIDKLKSKLLNLSAKNKAINIVSDSSTISLLTSSNQIILMNSEKKLLLGSQRSDGNIKASQKQEDFNKVVKELITKQSFYSEEYGIEVLYLTLGILKWNDKSAREYQSPLIFIPIRIKQAIEDTKYEIYLDFSEFEINYSLIEKLKIEYRLDISEIYKFDSLEAEQFQQFIINLQQKTEKIKFSVLDKSFISNFYFNNINLIKDIEKNYQNLENNELINSLLNGKSYINVPILTSFQAQENINIDSYYHPLNSDSSQEVAIQSMINGSSFVLQGPPGTGKSQTIINMISEAVARNKKVLFVAEKRAAIDVVKQWLVNLNLGDFIFDIYDVNESKKLIIEQLINTLNKIDNTQSEYASNSIQKITYNHKNNEKLIKNYFNVLNKNVYLEFNLYEIIGLYQNIASKYKTDFIFESPNKMNLHFNEQNINLFKLINQKLKLTSNYYEKPFSNFKKAKISLEDTQRLQKEFLNLLNLVNDVKKYSATLLKQNYANYSFNDVNRFIDFIELSKKHEFVKTFSLHDSMLSGLIENLLKIHNLSKRYENDNYLLALDNDKMANVTKVINKSNVSMTFSYKYQIIKKILKEYGIDFKKQDLYSINDDEVEYLEYKQNIQTIIKQYNMYIDFKDKEDLYNWISFALFMKKTREIFLDNKFLIQHSYKDLYDFIKLNLNDGNLNNFAGQYKQSIEFIHHYFDFDLDLSFDENMKNIQKILTNWTSVMNIFDLNNFVLNFENSEVKEFALKLLELQKEDDFEVYYEKAFYQSLITHCLKEISDTEYKFLDLKIQELQNLHHSILEISKSKLSQKIWDAFKNNEKLTENNNEVVLLKKESTKSRNIRPIKKLLEEIGNLILDLKPIFMMSPLSVSSYLKDSDINFDLVIFDEASQVKQESALTSLLRTKQVVIVGDSHQLPPTSFYEAKIEEEKEDYDDILAFDSLLDSASAILPTISLKWHYRSKFEHLIAPSNKDIYKNSLFTIPNRFEYIPNNLESLQYVYVNGIYENRANEKEADEVIKQIKNIIKKHQNKKSIGVVTYNTQQQKLIQQKLNKIAKEDKKLLSIINTQNNKDYLFVKNVESVQGDERDIIIISTTFGYDKNQRISMNFGPINNINHGYKRLNVAFTRAKESMILVSSLYPEDIDLSKTQSSGIIFFKNYLEYARNHLNLNNQQDSNIKSSLFAQTIYKELTNAGYDVSLSIGESNYKLDMVILDPKTKEFVIGIECDGSVDKNSDSMQDRDILRPILLQNNGWKIYRIWSSYWFENYDQEKQKLFDFINENINVKTNSKDKKIGLKIVNETKSLQPKKSKTTKLTFEKYPSYEKTYKKAKREFKDSDLALINFLKLLSPINIDEVKKYILEFMGQKQWSSQTNIDFKKILNKHKKDFEIKFDDDFICFANQEIKFRQTIIEKSERRIFKNIYWQELQNGILAIVDNQEKIDANILKKQIINLCGYTVLSKQMNEYLETILQKMSRTRKISYKEGQILKKS
ncbi:AAA domain-containing protein [[Mycoplasma] gypis]|uniref:AAA domain-containing protein n=1 Tax=[Mycoplasma] gypis TaxID=92404 RepID=A0ABZ2RPC0_9BACT|nr:AAA domain-containing protein [[Mycoplasma] gypis]MBN0919041.1 DUF4011 domain-containing protein [[Mycoplasma] gypis]